MMTEIENFGQRLENLRKSKNLSRSEIAEKLGISLAGYGNYENGKRIPKVEVLKNLSEIFQVSLDYLIGKSLNQENDFLVFLENIGFYCEELNDNENVKILMCENKYETFSKEDLKEIVQKAQNTVSSLTDKIMVHEILTLIDQKLEKRKENETKDGN